MDNVDYKRILDLLVCPECRTALQFKDRKIVCGKCKSDYPFQKEIMSFLSKQDKNWQKFFIDRLNTKTDEAQVVGYAYKENFYLIQDTLKKIIGALSNNLILDTGCGHGIMSGWLSEKNTVVGVDFVLDMLPQAKENGLIPIHADTMKLPFKKNSFDLVMAIEVIQHIDEGQEFILYLSRFVKDKGKILISGLNALSLLRQINRRARMAINPAYFNKGAPRLWNPTILAKSLKDSGFKIKMIYTFFPFRSVVYDKENEIKRHPFASNFFILAERI